MPNDRVLIDPTKIVAISDVVRQKLNETTAYTLDELPDAIRRITKTYQPYTPEQIQEFSERDLIIGARFGYTSNTKNVAAIRDNTSYCETTRRDGIAQFDITRVASNTYNRHHNDGNRKIGLIRGTLSDGSFCVSILGNGKLLRQGSSSSNPGASKRNYAFTILNSINLAARFYYYDQNHNQVWGFPAADNVDVYVSFEKSEDYWGGSSFNTFVTDELRRSAICNSTNYDSGAIRKAYALDYTPEWVNVYSQNNGYRFIRLFATLNNQAIDNDNDIQLTTNKDTTLTIGDMLDEISYTDAEGDPIHNNGKRYICGNLYDDLRSELPSLESRYADKSYYSNEVRPGTAFHEDVSTLRTGSYAAYNKLYNIPLTRDETAALQYIEDGTLPDDVIIYPFNVDNIKSNFI